MHPVESTLATKWSRRAFLQLGTVLTSLLALPPRDAAALAEVLRQAPRQPVIWLSFQECTGCTESLARSYAPSLERLLFDLLSLDYHHTLQAAAGEAAEAAREATLAEYRGRYLLVVDGAIALGAAGGCSTIAGESNLALLQRCAEGAAAVFAIGTCAAFGGLPAAAPNPTDAHGVAELMHSGKLAPRPLVAIPGCPPIPEAIAATLAHYLAFGALPQRDDRGRPLAFFGQTVHERCYRYSHFAAGRFARSFDDEGARRGWCLYYLGCRGPVTYSACATLKWNEGTSFPIASGHPCIGCTEPAFWDRGGFYRDLDTLATSATTREGALDELQQGSAVYDDYCVYCHSTDPSRLETPTDQIPALLESDKIRSHGRLRLSEEEKESLMRYLDSAREQK